MRTMQNHGGSTALPMANQPGHAQIRLLLLDDHALFRESLARFLACEPDFKVVGECGSVGRGLAILRGTPVDVVLLDFNLGTEHGNDFIATSRAAGYRNRYLIVAGAPDPKSSAAALKLGASGIFLKSDAPSRLMQAIRVVAAGAAWMDQRIVRRMADEVAAPPSGGHGRRPSWLLNERERTVLHGILGGLTNREIGGNEGMSEGTVKHTVQRLFTKAGVKSRSQLVRVALQGEFGVGWNWNS
jgi:two-component system, NarL family, nitrate/nitrite response regulator NarL